jgi:hypothetical protein
MKRRDEEREFLGKTVSKHNRGTKKLFYGPGGSRGTVKEFERQRRRKRDEMRQGGRNKVGRNEAVRGAAVN